MAKYKSERECNLIQFSWLSYTKTTSVSIKMLFHSEVITFKMTLARSKRIAEEPLLTLSAVQEKEWMSQCGK